MTSEESNGLASLVGEIALADATIDEWLVQLLYILSWPLDHAAVDIISDGGDSESRRRKVVKLADLHGWSELTPPGSDQSVKQTLQRVQKLKERRNVAVHSYYRNEPSSEGVVKYAKRGGVAETSFEELRSLSREMTAANEDLARITSFVERSLAERAAAESHRAEVLERCREVLLASPIHITDHVIRYVRSQQSVQIAFKNAAEWRFVGSVAEVDRSEAHALLNLENGKISVTFPDGVVIDGGDTGWRNVTEIAQETDPAVTKALLRRVHNGVRMIEERNSTSGDLLPLPDGEPPLPNLDERVFDYGPRGPVPPPWITEIEGFRP